MTLTLAQVEAMAPDQPSLKAGLKLAKRAAWVVLGADAGSGLAWGECQGSGSSPYKVIVAEADGGYKCTCPSRKFPCKHAIGLMLLLANGDPGFAPAEPPAWGAEWIAKRKPRSPRPGTEPAAGERPSLEAALKEPEAPAAPADPKALERAATQRERIAAEREASVHEGLDALDRWIADQLERGLVAFAAQARNHCSTIARRLVDAKAPALAARLDALASQIVALPERQRPDALIEALGGCHLLAEAYRRQDRLPEGLRAEIRRSIGWSLERQALMELPEAPCATGRWLVVAARTEIQPDKLRRIETWLMAEGEGAAPRFAVLMDFFPVSAGAMAMPFQAGERFQAELRFYPAATPLRAVVVTREASDYATDWRLACDPLAAALEGYEGRLAENPWLPAWPLALAGVAVRPDEAGALWIAQDREALPTPAVDADDLLALCDQPAIDMVGLWDGRHFRSMAAMTPLGPWLRT